MYYSHESLVLNLTPGEASISAHGPPSPSSRRWSRGAAGSRLRPAVGVDGGGGVAGRTRGPVRTRWAAQFGWRRAGLAWPCGQASAAATAPAATRTGGEGKPRRSARGQVEGGESGGRGFRAVRRLEEEEQWRPSSSSRWQPWRPRLGARAQHQRAREGEWRGE